MFYRHKVEHMKAANLGEALRMIMIERSWSQTRLARELGKDQPWVSRVIHDHKDPGTRAAAKLLARVGWELHITPKTDEGDDPVKRREFVAGAASALFVPTPKTTPFHDPQYIELLTRRTIQAHYQMGGNSLINTLLGQAQKISSASADGGPAMQSAASDFMRQASYILRNASRPSGAIRFAKTAIRSAGKAANPDQQAWAYCALILASSFNGGESTMSTGKRSGSQAVTLAQRGLAIPGIGPESRAYLNACLACGLANVPGNERRVRVALKEALTTNSASTIDQTDVIGITGNALRDIGERREAFKMFEKATFQASYRSPFMQAKYLCDQIGVALDVREPERAAALMNGLSYIVPLDSAMVDRQVEHVIRAAKPWETVPQVREARARLRSVRVDDTRP